jgi:hypothetical protein
MDDFQNEANYKQHESLSMSSEQLVNIYMSLLISYHNHFVKNMEIDFQTEKKNIKKSSLILYFQGIDSITNIFTLILLYTNNPDFAFYHTEKGIYYFLEFIVQIKRESSFVLLNTIDAVQFVYKKTIHQLKYQNPIMPINLVLHEMNQFIKAMRPKSLNPNFEKNVYTIYESFGFSSS